MRFLILLMLVTLSLDISAADAGPTKSAKKTGAQAKKNKKASDPTIYDAVRIWDKDRNRQIEGAEAEPLRAAVAESTGGVIKSLDSDNDGNLSDAELAAMNAALKPAKKAGEDSK